MQADAPAPRSDSAVKQILITMNEKEAPGFIVEDLDDFHLLIKPEAEYRIRNQLEAEARPTSFFSISCMSMTVLLLSSRRTRTAWSSRAVHWGRG